MSIFLGRGQLSTAPDDVAVSELPHSRGDLCVSAEGRLSLHFLMDRCHQNDETGCLLHVERGRRPSAIRGQGSGTQIGRSRGGLTTKIHALVDALGNPVELMLSPGQAHDLACAEPLIENADPDALIADKAYNSDPFVNVLTQREITPVIPPKLNCKTPRICDFALYCERNLVERFFNQLKHFRAIATRYDKLARNFLAGVQLAAITILLN